jgi:hypothetical protein
MIHRGDLELRRGSLKGRRIKPWWLVGSATCVLVGLILAMAMIDRAAYHRWQYERLWERWNRRGSTSSLEELEDRLFGDVVDRMLAHQEALAGIGDVDELHFHIRHIAQMSAREADLNAALNDGAQQGKLEIYHGVSSCARPSPWKLRLWCQPEFSDYWREAIAEFDRPITGPGGAIEESK